VLAVVTCQEIKLACHQSTDCAAKVTKFQENCVMYIWNDYNKLEQFSVSIVNQNQSYNSYQSQQGQLKNKMNQSELKENTLV